MTTSNPPPAQAHEPALTLSTYRKHTKNTPHKQHLYHLTPVNPPKFKQRQRRRQHRQAAHAAPSLSTPPSAPSCWQNYTCHCVEYKTSHHCRQMLAHTHTHMHIPSHTAIYPRKPAAHSQHRNKFSHTPPQHLVPANLCVKSIFYRATLPCWEAISCVFLSIGRFERNLAGIQWLRHLHLVPELQVTGLWDGPGRWDMQDWSSAVYGFR